jgi:two-component system sensor histidine kinase AtoS
MIGEMAATVAHEVRNPLSTVRMAAQRLQREFQVAEADREEYAELIDVLMSESDRVGTVVTEFLELGRPLALELEELPASQLLDEALAPLRLRSEQEDKRLQQETRGSAQVRVDRRRFTQLLGNLVSNALDAVPAQGWVRVLADCDRDGLHVTIEDNGAGMDADTLGSITKPFFTTKTRGTGLGLPLAKRLATAHGGSLSFSSQPGEGTQVQLFLPAKL